MHAHPGGRPKVEQRTDVEAPRITVNARRVATFDIGAERSACGRGDVDRRFEIDLAALIADTAADAGARAQLVGHRRIDVDGLHFGLDSLEAADPVRAVFGLETEGCV